MRESWVIVLMVAGAVILFAASFAVGYFTPPRDIIVTLPRDITVIIKREDSSK